MLRKIVILNILITQMFVTGFCFSEKDLSAIEMSKYGKVYMTDDFGTRLRRLETDFFGMTQSGDIETRINKLNQIAGSSNVSAIVPPLYPSKKRSAIGRFFDNITSSIYDPGVVTGYTPPLYSTGYTTNRYSNYYNPMNNHNFYPYNKAYGFNRPYRHPHIRNRNYNKFYKGVSRLLPHNNLRNNIINVNRPGSYGYNNYYRHPYNILPTNSVTNVATGSTVRILRD